MAQITKPLTVYLPDTRGVQISPFGMGNLKIGLGVFTYSKLPGAIDEPCLGREAHYFITDRESFLRSEFNVKEHLPVVRGTCPGSTPECRAICYAARPVIEQGPVFDVWQRNTMAREVPPIPEEAVLLRIHVSGDFDTVAYIEQWIQRLTERPDVTAWAYTKSWRVPELLPALERLRALPNVQLFASMDPSSQDVPPSGWRRAWIYRSEPKNGWPAETRLIDRGPSVDNQIVTLDGVQSYVCPEETGRKPNCVSCGYCFEGKKNDVTFLEH